jgi:lipoprotein-anchoring transpeptidase ErfK/SrfK
MIGRILSLTVAAMIGLAADAGAQSREVEVYYDRYGREVLVDVYSGEVIETREPRGSVERYGDTRPRRGERAAQDRYYLDDPDDVARLRREQRREELGRGGYGQRERLPDYDDYRAQPDSGFRDDSYDYRDQDQKAYEPPYQEPYREPGVIERGNIERAPLGEPPAGDSMAAIPDPNAPEGEVIIETPPTAVPDVRNVPQVAHGGAGDDVAKIQILLDRAGASPGVIDGRMGDNVNKAISAYRDLTGQALRTYDKQFIDDQLAATGGDPFQTYELTAVDVAGPFVAAIPGDYAEKALLDRLGFTSVVEMLSERFHMDERYLREINPGVSFDRPGTLIKVVNVPRSRKGDVMRIIADKSARQVRTYTADGKLLAVYPSTIGSAATPSPTGTHTVERVAINPEYTYNPKINFQQGNNTRVLTIPPGPNGPVGTVWVGLSKPTYGIHGTPEPSKIGKTESNGCIRLTNWDAQELAKMVKVGATVEFVD